MRALHMQKESERDTQYILFFLTLNITLFVYDFIQIELRIWRILFRNALGARFLHFEWLASEAENLSPRSALP